MDGFSPAEQQWVQRLGSLRNTVRQELVARQLATHVPAGSTVLDVGCGQGTQAVRLAAHGCAVVGVDPSADLLARLDDAARAARVSVETHVADVDGLTSVLGDRAFDVVCAHGLLMYLADVPAALGLLVDRVRPGGLLSVTFRNAAALAFRPGMRGRWGDALAAFDASTYVNELGVRAAAHHLEDVVDQLRSLGAEVEAWYGVRVFTDAAAADEPVPPDPELLLATEEQAGRRDPYRQLASQVHLVARRGATACLSRHTRAGQQPKRPRTD